MPIPVFNEMSTKINASITNANRGINFTNDQKIAVQGLTEFINNNFDEQKYIYGLIGPGGVGKTFVIKYIIRNCKYATSVIRFTAPTHKACRVFSQALDGIETYTIQSTFGFRINMSLADFDYKNPQFDPMASPKLENIELLVIDESSMLPAGLVQYINNVCRKQRIKLIYIGDASQLPPVKERKSKAFDYCVKLFYLNEIVRQGASNPILNILDMLRADIRNNTTKTISYFAKHIGEINYNDNGEGYSIIGRQDFIRNIANRFQDEEYTSNIDKYKIISYTNLSVTQWNNFVRQLIISQADRGIITKNDLIMSYKTIVDEFNSVIINNSEEYIINDIVNYTDAKYNIKGYLVKFQLVNGGQITKPLFVIDHTDKFTILKYVEILDELVKAAKSSTGAVRSKRWKEYFDFKDKYLIANNITRGGQIIYSRDLDYGFAITSHKSQGSTYENVFVDVNDIVFDRNGQIYPNLDDMLRRLYVACSRAKKDLIICYGR